MNATGWISAVAVLRAIAWETRCGAIQTGLDAPTRPLEPGGVVQLAGDVSATMPSSLGRSSTSRRVPCDAVISELHKNTRATKPVNVSTVANTLGTTVAWAEHCMIAYGRRPPRQGVESSESKEAEIESYEEDEPEESMPEDTEEEGAPDLKLHPERQKLLKVHPPPTPREGREAEEGYGSQ
jgi:hypothetical protein